MLRYKNTLSFIAILILVALNNNCYELLSNHGVRAPQTLFYRGVFTLLFASAYALIKGQKIFPSHIRAQSVRFITTGGSLLLILQSYFYLSAGTVSLLQRLDIPFLILISLTAKHPKKLYQVTLSVITIAIIIYIAIDPSLIDEDATGFFLVFGSVSMTAIGYLTVHKGSTNESVPALVNISGISAVFFGAGLILFKHYSWSFAPVDFGIIAISAIINVLLFYITIEQYKIFKPERALLPFVWSICSTSVLEMVLEKKLYNNTDIFITIGLTIIISLICLGGKTNLPVKKPKQSSPTDFGMEV